MFIELKENRTGLHITCWTTNFDYSESCSHVYLKKSVYKNGKKSTVSAYARATNQDIPDILQANTYFWSPGSSSSWRRANESKRNAELAEFETDNEQEMLINIQEYAASLLEKGEMVKIDEDGIYLRYRRENYHLDKGILNARTLQIAREGIKRRRATNVREYFRKKTERLKADEQENIFLEKASKVFVTKEDSLKSGNCEVGTNNFIESLSLTKRGFHVRAVKGDALLNIRNDSYTRRAVKEAISHS